MPQLAFLFWALLLCSYSNLGSARTLTDIKGRTIEVDVIQISETTVTIRRTNSGDQFEIPLENLTIADREALKREQATLGDQKSFEPLNEAIGIPLWADPLLWDDQPEDIAERLNWQLEYQTRTLACYRHYFDDQAPLIAGARPYSAALFVINGKADYLSITFANILDSTSAEKRRTHPAQAHREVGKAIRTDLKSIEKCLKSLSKKRIHKRRPQNDSSDFSRWDIQNSSFILSTEHERYINLQIMPQTLASWFEETHSEKRKIESRPRSQTPASNGDVTILDLPNVSAGPKQLTHAATLEAFMRHSNTRADLYLLATHLYNTEAPTLRLKTMLSDAQQFAQQDGIVPARTYPRIRSIDSAIRYGRSAICILEPLEQLESGLKDQAEDTDNGQTLTPNSAQNETAAKLFIIVGYNEQNQTLALTNTECDYTVHWLDEATVLSADLRQNFYILPYLR